MGPIGFPEMMIIMVVALLLFGPRKLPQLGRTLGRGMAEFRKASNELKRTLNAEMIQEEIRQSTEVIRESDPRRMLRDAMKEAPQQVRGEPTLDAAVSESKESESNSDTPTEATSDETPSTDEAPSTAEAKAEGPEGTVARSTGSSIQEPSDNTSSSSS